MKNDYYLLDPACSLRYENSNPSMCWVEGFEMKTYLGRNGLVFGAGEVIYWQSIAHPTYGPDLILEADCRARYSFGGDDLWIKLTHAEVLARPGL